MDTLLQLQIFCEIAIFVSVVFMNVIRKNRTLVLLYTLQSLALVLLLSVEAYLHASWKLFLLVLCIFIVKIVVAGSIFLAFIRRSGETFSLATYLNAPMTVGALALITVFTQSGIFAPLFAQSNSAAQLGLLLVASALMAFFLIINCKGALPQLIGILALENSIFAMGHFLNPEQSSSLEIGILFDVLFWIIVASIYIRMLYKQYHSLDVAALKELQK